MQHEVEWTPDRVQRFWNYMSSTPGFEDLYFAKRAGPSLITYLAKRIDLGTVVDIGCGRGDLINLLLERGYDAYGCDQSEASVEGVNKRFAGNSHFKGAAVGTGLPDGIADTVTMLEVVEHLDDVALVRLIEEAWRILKVGGHLVLTTPNDEDLEGAKRMCPECGAVFHHMQHVRSWTGEGLSAFLRAHGFTRKSANATLLTHHRGLVGVLHKLRFARLKQPNLVYIGQKR